MFNLALQDQIRLEPSSIPREENQTTDYLSRIVDCDGWQLNMFSMLDVMYGQRSIYRFALVHNTQLSCFNSRFWNQGSEAVDAFTVDWSGENTRFCPPVALVLRVLRHA